MGTSGDVLTAGQVGFRFLLNVGVSLYVCIVHVHCIDFLLLFLCICGYSTFKVLLVLRVISSHFPVLSDLSFV